MKNREYILSKIIKNGKLNHYCLKKEWFVKKQLLDVYEKILTYTSFLDSYDDISLRERIYCIQNGINSLVKCKYCEEKVKYNKNKVSYNKICNSTECKKKIVSESSVIMWENFTEEQLENRRNKIKEYQKNNPTIHSKEGIEKIIKANIGRKQSQVTKTKRVESRRRNNDVWHKESTIRKLSESNKKNFECTEFKLKHMQRLKESAPIISKKIKSKILRGDFTPPITNSWTNWNSYVNIKGGIKKFRSSWEAVYWLNNKNLLYEKIRIPYMDESNKNKIYIVDFLDTENNILIEIKPKSCKLNKKNLLKEKYAKEWSNKNSYLYNIVDDEWFFENVKNINFEGNEHLLKPMKQFL